MHKLIQTSDGSHTIYIPELDEHYHSIHGAIGESRHVFLGTGYRFSGANPVRIFEAGFGTGLNALLTAIECGYDRRTVLYTAIEKYPLETGIINSLNHGSMVGNEGIELYEKIHAAQWNCITEISHFFSLEKIEGDLIELELSGSYDLIYFDAFGPDKQPDMWSPGVFEKISSATAPEGIFVTYSAKGSVKRNLKACGFSVELLPGPPGKRQIIRAIKN
jgi:tRNA U34 5-methylaminomethyl-2-thiouridine-forming methyltransferase MnmC